MSLFKQISQKVVEAKEKKKDGSLLQTVAQLTPAQKKDVYFHVKSRLVEQGPETAEELWNYVRTVYGFRIPLTATTEDSNAPFEWFYDYYFDKHTQTFAIGSRGGGKALALDTYVLTTNEWKNHGELIVGDYVYGSDNQPTKVTEVHPIQHGKKCYSLLIDGEEIVADAEHLWPVLVNPNTFELPYRTILTSEECWNAYHLADAYLHIGVEGRSFILDDIFETESVPVSCITVEAEDHLYLVGQSKIPTHNTYPATFGIDMKCRFRQNYEVVHVAAEKAQAKVSQGYIAGFYKDEYLKDFFARKPSAYAAEWRSGSTWRTVTASRSGISGSHPQQLTLDEIEFWPTDAIEQSFAVPQERNGYPAQHHMFSTRQRSFGASNYLTNQIEQGKKQIKLYKWTIFETMQRCPSCVCMKGDRVISNPEQACALWEDCVKWDQLVQTSNRGPVRIKDLTTQDKVYSWSGGNLTTNKVTKVWSKGVKKTYAVTTLHRKRIEGTYEHPVLTAQYEKVSCNRGKWSYEWKPLGSLTKKDLVVTAREIGPDKECREVNGVYIDDDLLYLIGLYIGDGTLQEYSLLIAEFESSRVGEIQRIVKDRWDANSSIGAKTGVKISSSALVNDFTALGFTKKLSFEKTLPSWFWKLSKEQVKIFLAGYVDSDGCVTKSKNGVTTAIASTSYVLLQQIRNLCLFVGYTHIGSINLTKRKFPLMIRGKELNPDTVKPIYSFEFRVGNKKSIGYLYNNIPSLQKFLPSDETNFRLETVLSIEETGEHEVYDISVENDHNFIAEGIVVHNCKGIRGLKSSGWVPREEVIKYRNTLDRKEWEVQYLCTRPSSHGLVLYNFEHTFASPADLDAGNFLKWEYAPELPLYAVHDPAEGQKSVFAFFQIFNGRIFFFDELVQQPCATVSEVKKALWKKLRKEGYPDPKKIIVDPHRTDAGADWVMGTKTGEEIERSYVVEYPDMTTGYAEIEKGLGLLRTFVCNGSQRRLYINPEKCPSLDLATREHHYRIPKGGELTDDAPPDKAYKDECDTMRYAVIWGTQFGGLKTFDLTIHLLG